MTFIEILNNPEARNLLERIEELVGEEERELVRIREDYIKELEDKFDYKYEA